MSEDLKPLLTQLAKGGSLSSADAETAFDVTNISLGENISPWGKKFKFRFISKKTGKKIDFNMTFKTKMEKGVLEEQQDVFNNKELFIAKAYL